MALTYRTRGMSTPQGKAKVFFACYEEDFDQYFTCMSNEILASNDCAIWYATSLHPAELEEVLLEMQLIVVPVTARLLYCENNVVKIVVPFAIKHHIPILPIMQETGLVSAYSKVFGNIQFLDKSIVDETAIEYGKKLKQYLASTLVSDELAQKIRGAFDAYIFLSYRKKDRKHAQELMRLIHENDFCRDIAIWYDEFLVPGEDFNNAIEQALNKSELFALVVTPNLVNEPNYVRDVEYPLARQEKKPVLPVELVSTDYDALRSGYEDIPPCTTTDTEMLRAALLSNLGHIAHKASDSPEHNFFIGLAYLEGLDLEVNYSKAVSLITSSAERGLSAAMHKLATMYHIGQGVTRKVESAIFWQEKYVQSLLTEDACFADDYEQYASARFELASLWTEIDEYDKAIAAVEPLQSYENSGDSSLVRLINNTANLVIGRLYDKKRQLLDAKRHYKSVYLSYGDAEMNKLSEDDFIIWIQSCLALLNKSTDGHIYAVKALELAEEFEVPIGTKCYIWQTICNLTKPFSMRVSEVFAEMAVNSYEKLAAESGFSRNAQLDLASAYRQLGSCCVGLGDIDYNRDDKRNKVYAKAIKLLEDINVKYETDSDRRALVVTYYEYAMSCSNEDNKRALIEKTIDIAQGVKCIAEYADVMNAVMAGIGALIGIHIRSGDDTAVDEYVNLYAGYANLLIDRGDRSAWYKLRGVYSSAAAMYKHKGCIERSEYYMNREASLVNSISHWTELDNDPSRQNAAVAVADYSATESTACYEKLARIAIQHLRSSNTLNGNLELSRIYEHLAILLDKNGNAMKARMYYRKAMVMRKKGVNSEADKARARQLSNSYVRMGDRYRTKKKYYLCLLNYKKALSIYPSDHQTMHKMAEVYAERKKYKKANQMADHYVACRENMDTAIFGQEQHRMNQDDVFVKYSSYGGLYFTVNNMSIAEDYYIRAYQMRNTPLKETKNPSLVLEKLALVCYRLGLLIPNTNSLEYLVEAEKYYSELITNGAHHWQSRLDEIRIALSNAK